MSHSALHNSQLITYATIVPYLAHFVKLLTKSGIHAKKRAEKGETMAAKPARPEIVRAMLARRSPADPYLRLDLRNLSGPGNIPANLVLRLHLRGTPVEAYREVERLPARECLGGLWVGVLFAPVDPARVQCLELLRGTPEESESAPSAEAMPLPESLLCAELYFPGGCVGLGRAGSNRYFLKQSDPPLTERSACQISRVVVSRQGNRVELLIFKVRGSGPLPKELHAKLYLNQAPAPPLVVEFVESEGRMETGDNSLARVFLAPTPETARQQAQWLLRIAAEPHQKAVLKLELQLGGQLIALHPTVSDFFCPSESAIAPGEN